LISVRVEPDAMSGLFLPTRADHEHSTQVLALPRFFGTPLLIEPSLDRAMTALYQPHAATPFCLTRTVSGEGPISMSSAPTRAFTGFSILRSRIAGSLIS
jgi:hypothetical protein